MAKIPSAKLIWNGFLRVTMKVLNSYVKSYIQNLRFALSHGAKINFQEKRLVDENRPEKYTNQYTVRTLFPDENPVDALKRELLSLSSENYMRTVKDLRFPKRSEMREFGKVYNSHCLLYTSDAADE